MSYVPKQVRKAIVGGVATTGAAVGTAMLDGALTQAEVIVATGLGLVAGFGVFKVKNAPS